MHVFAVPSRLEDRHSHGEGDPTAGPPVASPLAGTRRTTRPPVATGEFPHEGTVEQPTWILHDRALVRAPATDEEQDEAEHPDHQATPGKGHPSGHSTTPIIPYVPDIME
ncbi:hypothetical protein GCM10029978_089100 [Actinoallomurus acanthiterrae]